MPQEYSWEIREDARGLYVINGMTYEQVAKQTGVSLAQIKRWGGDEGWVARRREYRRAKDSIEENKMLLRGKLLQNALDTHDPQDVYAAAAMEKLAGSVKVEVVKAAPKVPDMEFDGPGDLVEKLWGAIQVKAAAMISSPDDMNLNDLKPLKAGLDLFSEMKRQYAKPAEETAKKKELDDHAMQTIKDIYGLS